MAKYGLTLEEYDRMLETQGGGCGICGGTNPDGRRLHVDHDHKTGKVRGLLCINCNYLIGRMEASADLLPDMLDWILDEET